MSSLWTECPLHAAVGKLVKFWFITWCGQRSDQTPGFNLSKWSDFVSSGVWVGGTLLDLRWLKAVGRVIWKKWKEYRKTKRWSYAEELMYHLQCLNIVDVWMQSVTNQSQTKFLSTDDIRRRQMDLCNSWYYHYIMCLVGRGAGSSRVSIWWSRTAANFKYSMAPVERQHQQ